MKLFRHKNGQPVLAKGEIIGTGIMGGGLLELGSQDNMAFLELNYQQWTEKNQHSVKNNEFIFLGIKKAVKKYL